MKIRGYKKEDKKQIIKIYQKTFAGFPWFENLSIEEVKKRWNSHKVKRGFRCLVAVEGNKILGATWQDIPTIDELRLERGNKLADFIQIRDVKFIVWIRETCVDPSFQGRGLGRKLKSKAIEKIKSSKLHCIILTRLRNDNSPIIHLNSLLGFQRTGIKMPSSQKKDVFHEYWYLEVGKERRMGLGKYVVSEDIHILLQEWAAGRKFGLPSNEFFRKLRVEMEDFLEGIFGRERVEIVPAGELKRGIKSLISQAGLFPISIDRVYFRTNPSLEINRTVNRDLVKEKIDSRFGLDSISKQIRRMSKYLPKEIILVDDVIFSGNMLSNVIDVFSYYDKEVKLVIGGIVTKKGFEYLHQRGVKVRFVRFYPEVIDEICERDFYPGVPLSGRLVAGQKVETGAPYLLPFGKPHEWASIPKEKEREFSVFCLKQTIKLWEAIEKSSGKIVKCRDLERVPLGIVCSVKRFVDELRKVLKSIL